MKKILLVLICISLGGGLMAAEPTILEHEASLFGLSPVNNFLFWIPPLAWNIAFGASIPLDHFSGPVPEWIPLAENILRVAMVTYPMALPINTKHDLFTPGLIVYTVGLLVYFGCWTYLTHFPDTELAQNPIMRFSPVFTPLIWLAGISMMSRSAAFPVMSTLFIGFHMGEYVISYNP